MIGSGAVLRRGGSSTSIQRCCHAHSSGSSRSQAPSRALIDLILCARAILGRRFDLDIFTWIAREIVSLATQVNDRMRLLVYIMMEHGWIRIIIIASTSTRKWSLSESKLPESPFGANRCISTDGIKFFFAGVSCELW